MEMHLSLTGFFDTREAEEEECGILHQIEIETEFLEYNFNHIKIKYK